LSHAERRLIRFHPDFYVTWAARLSRLPDDAADDMARAAAAIDVACAKLCVGKLIGAEDLTGAVCDEHSTMTYLSLFRDAMDPKDRRVRIWPRYQAGPPPHPTSW